LLVSGSDSTVISHNLLKFDSETTSYWTIWLKSSPPLVIWILAFSEIEIAGFSESRTVPNGTKTSTLLNESTMVPLTTGLISLKVNSTMLF